MEKVLSQEEIDAMVRAARGQHEASPQAEQRSVKPCSFRQSGQLTGEQVRALTILHEGFARNLTQSLGAYLRVVFEATLARVEQVAYAEFLQRVPEVTYMMSFQGPSYWRGGCDAIRPRVGLSAGGHSAWRHWPLRSHDAGNHRD